MANRTFEVSLGTVNMSAYFRASGGRTAQCRSFLNDKTYVRVNTLVERKYKVSLSMDKCQLAARHAARKIKAELGTKIQDNAQLTMGMVLKWVENEVKRKNDNPIDITEFGVHDISELLCKINKPVKLEVKPRRYYGRKSA